MATLIFMNGMPGVGKTTLLKSLSEDLNVGYITKDSIKELLGDTLYTEPDVERSYFGKASVTALFAIVNAFLPSSKVMFVENAFWHDMTTDAIKDLKKSSNVSLMQIYVTCDQDELVARFSERIKNGTRHRIHPDIPYSGNDFDANKNKYRPLEIEGMQTYRFDTSSNSSDTYADLKQWLVEHLEENNDETTN